MYRSHNQHLSYAPCLVARLDQVLVFRRLLGVPALEVRDEVGDEKVLAEGRVAVLPQGMQLHVGCVEGCQVTRGRRSR